MQTVLPIHCTICIHFKTQCAVVHVESPLPRACTLIYIPDIYQSRRAFSVSGTQWHRACSAIYTYTHTCSNIHVYSHFCISAGACSGVYLHSMHCPCWHRHVQLAIHVEQAHTRTMLLLLSVPPEADGEAHIQCPHIVPAARGDVEGLSLL